MSFQKIFISVLAICSVPTFGLIWFLENNGTFEGIGIGNTIMTAVVTSALPTLLISIWWWNKQQDD
jgi:hypothetical protein